MTTCGVGGWGGPAPGDPSNNSTLTATPQFGGIRVAWTLPTTNAYAVSYIKLYRGISDVFASALPLSDETGSSYFDEVDSATTYYYWIRIVSVNGTVGDLIGPASALGKTIVTNLLEQLTGQIDAGVLASSLNTTLYGITLLDAAILQEITDRETGETNLAAALAAVDLGIAEAHTFLLDEVATRTSQNSALITTVDGVVATLGGEIASVLTTTSASIDDLTGEVEALYQVQLTVDGQIGGFGLYGGGGVIEAGFDVDLFWIGRTNADRVKPFVISGGVVYIDSTVIQDAAITNAKIGFAEITTLKIAGEQITVPRFYSATNQSALDGLSERSLITATFDPEGGGFLGALTFTVKPVGVDAYGEAYIYVEGVLIQTQKFGIRTSGGGDTYYSMTVSVPFASYGLVSLITVEAKAKAVPHPGGATNNIDISNITMSIMSGKR